MSTIGLVWSWDGRQDVDDLTARLVGSRSPRARVHCKAGGLALGVHSARIEHGPIWSLDRSVCLIADVRLDNRNELIDQLSLGKSYLLSDACLVLHAWMRWGEDCVHHLLGGFAFALWESANGTIFAARDHTGESPLFYKAGNRGFALASTQQALLQLDGIIKGKFQDVKILDYFTNDPRGSDLTYFEGIQRLGMGEVLIVKPEKLLRRSYWDPLSTPPTRFGHDREYADALTDLIDTATSARIASAESVGSHLTAGFDSSSITSAAAQQLASEGRRLIAFTAIPGSRFQGTAIPWGIANEGPAANDVARLYPNIEHVLVTAQDRNLMADVEAMVALSSEPVRNALNISWMLAILNDARQRKLDLMLTGQLGNATISYEGTLALRDLFRSGRWVSLCAAALALRRNGEVSARESVQTALDGLLPGWLTRRLLPRFNPQRERGLTVLHPDLVAKHQLLERCEETHYAELQDTTAERRWFLANIDLANYYRALATLSCVPTLDPTGDKRLFEFCFSIPVEQFIAGGRSRSLVRRAMQGRLPQRTLERRERGHQAADWHSVLTANLPCMRAEFAAIERSPAAQHYLNLPYLRGLLEHWPTKGFDTGEGFERWNVNLTKGLTMGHFLRTHECFLN